NTYVAEAIANPAEKLPIEFSGLVLGIELKKYTPEDLMAGAVMVLRHFGASGGTELSNKAFFDDMVKRHGTKTAMVIFDDILPLTDPDAYTTSLDQMQAQVVAPSSHDYAALSDSALKKSRTYRDTQIASKQALVSVGLTLGASRTILVGPERSATGNPLMMQATADGGDMHLVSPEINFAGLFVPPIAMPIMGRSPTAGMLITTGERDTRDVFSVKTDPENKHRYFYKGDWHDMESRTETIKVAGQEDTEYVIYRTVHGPVILWDDETNIAYTQRWAIWGQEANIWASAFDSLKVKDADGYAAQLEQISASNSNISYADVTGSIGFRHMGDIPLRAHGIDPRLPANGDGSEDWQGIVSDEQTPKLRDPEKGYIFIWNNSPAPGTVFGDGSRWGKTFRTHLPVSLIEEKEKISIEDLKSFNKLIGASFYSIDLTLTSPRFFDAFFQEAAEKTNDPKVKEAATLIMAWDGLMTDKDNDGSYDAVGLTLFRKWLPTALETVFDDDIGTWWKDLDDDLYIPYQTSLLVRALEGDDAGLPLKRDYFNGQDRASVVIESLQRTIEALEPEFKGRDIADWHQPVFWQFLNFTDIGDSDKPRMKRYRSTTYSGAGTTFGYLPKAIVDNGMPAWTAIMEITDENPHYLSSIPSGGQSWFINQDWKASPHIKDQYDKHANFNYKTVSLDKKTVQSDYEARLVIHPK
ncbi:MAG: penicillin acylase family protein, partial [Kordiimonadaceae bacterium]|nr:penicillin acylase family protein [Kordiimonadaceae bacterium]